jgi:hypothetical protein
MGRTRGVKREEFSGCWGVCVCKGGMCAVLIARVILCVINSSLIANSPFLF